MGGGARL